MRSRIVQGLVWARAASRPEGIPVGRPRGKKAAGVRYEKLLAGSLPWASHGQWWQYQDSSGVHYCQTDLMFTVAGMAVVLEAKYTWTEDGHRQVDGLYRQVVAKATRLPCIGLVVCKVLTRETPRAAICGSLEEALAKAAAGKPSVWHWLGVSSTHGRPALLSPTLHPTPSRLSI